MKHDIRLIASDLDGTLVNSKGEIEAENLSALLKAQERGIYVCAFSGRFPGNASLVMHKYGFTGPVCASNGCEILDTPFGRPIETHLMEKNAARRATELLNRYEADYFIFAPGVVYNSNPEIRHHTELSDFKTLYEEHGIVYCSGQESLEKILQRGICKFYVRVNQHIEELKQALSPVEGLYITRSGNSNIELMPTGVDKGTALESIARYLNIPLSCCMTFGDQDNDLPMLLKAGFGVAMGNADDEIKSRVWYVTDSCGSCGVGKAVRKFALDDSDS